jgi:hypothetical protein
MPGVSASIGVRIQGKQTGAGDLGTPQLPIDIDELLDFSAGTAAVGQANVLFQDTRTIAASGNEDLDVAGVLTDAFGASIAAAEIVAIFIKAHEPNTNSVQVTRPAANGVPLFLAASDGLSIAPGDFFLLTRRTGVTVTAATGDLINIANSGAGTGVTYDVVIIGRTIAA